MKPSATLQPRRRGTQRWLLACAVGLAFEGVGGQALAQARAPGATGAAAAPPRTDARPAPPRAAAQLIDRAVVRFYAAETGGVASPQFIYERELAFEARLEALTDKSFRAQPRLPFRERHIRAAMERHISETLLAALRIDRPPEESELRVRALQSRQAWVSRVGGELALADAASAEGWSPAELLRMFRRQARASFYVDRMITPMLKPSRAELESLHRSAETPFRGKAFRDVEPLLRHWYVSRRVSVALQGYFQNARARIHITLL